MERKLAKVGVEDALSALGETKHKKALLSIDVNASKKERHLNWCVKAGWNPINVLLMGN